MATFDNRDPHGRAAEDPLSGAAGNPHGRAASDPHGRVASDVSGWAHQLSKRDWIIVGCGALVLIASFLPWEAASGGMYTDSASAWNSGFGAWFGSLLCAAAAAAVAARHLGYLRGVGAIGPNHVACGLAAVGAALLIIRLLTLPRGTGGLAGVSGSYGYGPSFGAFAGVGLAVVQAIVSLLNVRTSGEKLPALSTTRSAPASPAQAPPQAWNAARAQPSARPTWDAAQAQPQSAWDPTQGRDPAQRRNTSPGQDAAQGRDAAPVWAHTQPQGATPAWDATPAPARDVPLASVWDAGTARDAAPQARGEYVQPASYGQPGGYSPAPPQAGTERSPADQELAQRLSRLDDLRARGLISDAEHADQRRRIISQL